VTMNNKRAIAVRKRQSEALTTRIADNDRKPSKKTTPSTAPRPKPRRPAGITLAQVSICRSDE
jgi:hypothetical protein